MDNGHKGHTSRNQYCDRIKYANNANPAYPRAFYRGQRLTLRPYLSPSARGVARLQRHIHRNTLTDGRTVRTYAGQGICSGTGTLSHPRGQQTPEPTTNEGYDSAARQRVTPLMQRQSANIFDARNRASIRGTPYAYDVLSAAASVVRPTAGDLPAHESPGFGVVFKEPNVCLYR